MLKPEMNAITHIHSLSFFTSSDGNGPEKYSLNVGQIFHSAAHLYHFAADVTVAFCSAGLKNTCENRDGR